ncbi:MAG: hypothetical protein NT031_13920 [Planctomycetota bacterium]|nr:hypothetical protein [Planctomycetota bacterium]
MLAADKASDRDSRVAHLRKALLCRRDHQDNIAIEYRIGIELSQRTDPKGTLPTEALAVFDKIVKTYKHMAYYSPEPANYSGSTQLMVPQAAILAACLERGLNGDSQKAQDYLVFAMERLNETYKKRVQDWGNPPTERPPSPFDRGPMEMSKRESRARAAEQRKIAAEKGDVFGLLEMASVKAAVRQYGYSRGPQQPFQVPAAMGEIVTKFPGSPMAKVAQEHAARAVKMTEKELYAEVPERLANVPTTSGLDSAAEATGGKPASAPFRNGEGPREAAVTRPAGTGYGRYAWALGVIAGGIVAGTVIWRRRSGSRTSKPLGR